MCAGAFCWFANPLMLVGSLVVLGCSSTKAPETPQNAATQASETPAFECPALDGRADFDLSTAFGIERPLAVRIERMMRLTSELEASATRLNEETKLLCGNLAVALTGQALGANEDACEVALARANAAWPSLRAAGLSVSAGEISCTIPRDALARCAGECITGKPDVFSRVTCEVAPSAAANALDASLAAGTSPVEAAAEACGFDFAMPDASLECTTQCGVRALRDVTCAVDVQVRFDGPDAERYQNLALVLRRDLPRLSALGRSFVPQAARASANVNRFVDDLGAVLDGLRSNERVERGAVIGAVLAGCVGPRLGSAVRAGAELQATLRSAESIRAGLLTP